jgi:hypothetical protein
MLNIINTHLTKFNESKLLMGMILIVLNVSSKYVEFGFSKTQEHALRNGLARELLIFAIAFTGTRDIVTSIIITASFFVLSELLFHEESKFCVISNKMKKFKALIDTNKDGIITPEEEEKALKILKKAEKQRTKNLQGEYLSYMGSNYTSI